MVVERGQIWWADLDDPSGSGPAFRRPILVVQSDAFNRSRLRTVVRVVLTSNLRLVEAPGNVLVPGNTGPCQGLGGKRLANHHDGSRISRPAGRPHQRPAAQGCRKQTPARSRPLVSTGCQLPVRLRLRRTLRIAPSVLGAAQTKECRSIRALRAAPRTIRLARTTTSRPETTADADDAGTSATPCR